MKPRFQKSRKIPIHLGRPLNMRGWQCQAKYEVVAWAHPQRRYRLIVTEKEGGLPRARELCRELLKEGWESTQIRLVEILFPRIELVATK